MTGPRKEDEKEKVKEEDGYRDVPELKKMGFEKKNRQRSKFLN